MTTVEERDLDTRKYGKSRSSSAELGLCPIFRPDQLISANQLDLLAGGAGESEA